MEELGEAARRGGVEASSLPLPLSTRGTQGRHQASQSNTDGSKGSVASSILNSVLGEGRQVQAATRSPWSAVCCAHREPDAQRQQHQNNCESVHRFFLMPLPQNFSKTPCVCCHF